MLLYIHPAGHLNDLVVPAGAVSCLNAVRCEKLGRYAFEVTEAEIAAAKVVALDLHWSVALPAFERLLALVRRVAPRVPVVVGGITAGHYARELSLRYPVDYVLRGDSETSFRSLVEALEAGKKPPATANTFSHGKAVGPEQRMTGSGFDATDCLTVDWFPTYARATDLDAPAFVPARTIPMARGCRMRCPTCYGSYCGTFGPGVLYRSPEAAALQLRRASGLKARNLRAFLGKPPADLLAGWLAALAEAGPYRFSTRVGLFLCQAPDAEGLEQLEAAFPDGAVLTMVPPAEHTPKPGPRGLKAETAAWEEVSRRVQGSSRLQLDAWVMSAAGIERERRSLAPDQGRRVTVSLGSVWKVTRPTGQGRNQPLAELSRSMAHVWTFYAAKLLSPGLAGLLAPFRLLDELEADPESLPPPAGPRRAFFERIMRSWKKHKLPLLPDLRWAVVGVELKAGPAAGTEALQGVRLSGSLRHLPAGSFAFNRPMTPAPLTLSRDHRGEELRASLSFKDSSEAPEALAFLPLPPSGRTASSAWARAMGTHGLTALLIPPGAAKDRLSLLVSLRAQQAGAVLLRGSSILARGRSHLVSA